MGVMPVRKHNRDEDRQAKIYEYKAPTFLNKAIHTTYPAKSEEIAEKENRSLVML